VSSLTELIREHQTGNADETAAAVFTALGCPQEWRDIFYLVVRDECRRLYRYHVAAAERASASDGAMARTEPNDAPPLARGTFLTEHFYTGDRYVLWGTATVDQITSRINFLRKQIYGMESSVELLKNALTHIVGNGVSCLNELSYVPDLRKPFQVAA
jgi:hypothetical protein